MGFQIRPVPGFRGPGTISWIGTNHMNRCLQPFLPAEQVLELVPPADPRQPWTPLTLSTPATSTPTCPPDYTDGTLPIYPGDDITSRPGYGQGAPGVFGYGDIDGDGDLDLAVSGDGDRRLFWIEQLAGGATRLHRLTSDGEQFGQSGGAAVQDLDGDGAAELVFSSFDRDTVAIWKRRPRPAVPPTGPPTGPPPAPVERTTVVSSLRASLDRVRVERGRTARLTIRLTGARGGAARAVRVRIATQRGRATVRTVRLRRTGPTTHRAVLSWRPRKAGRVRVDYAGTTVSPTLRDTRARATARVVLTR